MNSNSFSSSLHWASIVTESFNGDDELQARIWHSFFRNGVQVPADYDSLDDIPKYTAEEQAMLDEESLVFN